MVSISLLHAHGVDIHGLDALCPIFDDDVPLYAYCTLGRMPLVSESLAKTCRLPFKLLTHDLICRIAPGVSSVGFGLLGCLILAYTILPIE